MSSAGAGGSYHRRNSQLSSRSPDSPALKHKRSSRSRGERDHHPNGTVRRRRSRTAGDDGEVEVSYTPSRSHSGDSPNTRHSFSLSHSRSLSRYSNDERRRGARRRKNRSAEEHIDFETSLHGNDDDDHTRPAGSDESTYFATQNTLTRKSTLQDREVPVTSPLAKRASFSATRSHTHHTHRGSFSARARALTAGSESHFRASKHNLQIRIGDDSTLYTQGSGTGILLGSKSESLSNVRCRCRCRLPLPLSVRCLSQRNTTR